MFIVLDKYHQILLEENLKEAPDKLYFFSHLCKIPSMCIRQFQNSIPAPTQNGFEIERKSARSIIFISREYQCNDMDQPDAVFQSHIF